MRLSGHFNCVYCNRCCILHSLWPSKEKKRLRQWAVISGASACKQWQPGQLFGKEERKGYANGQSYWEPLHGNSGSPGEIFGIGVPVHTLWPSHPVLHTQSPCCHLLSEWQVPSCAGQNSASAARTTASYAITIVQDCSATAGKHIGLIHCFVECVCTSDTCSCMTASTCPFECPEQMHAATCRTCAASCS